ncbi:MAG: hypothetical protein ISS69_12565 [Phycisphaerae bacterium]|nr:hypothetical protein [Phycisphaerae bacterium]
MKTIRRFMWVLAVLVVAVTPLLAAPGNIAPRAKVTSNSEHSGSHAARLVADGKIPALGGCNGAGREWAAKGNTHPRGVTLAFKWAKPVTISEVVYYSRSSYAVEGFKDYELHLDDATKPAVKGQFKCGHGPQRIKLPAPVQAIELKLKFTSWYKSFNPGAAEIQVYSTSPPDKVLGAFKPLPVFKIYNAGGRRAAPPAPRIVDSPELAARVKAGKLGFDKLVVVKRHEMNPSHVYTYHAESFKGGGGLYVYSAADGKLTELLASPEGEIIDVDVSFDGKEILFGWKKSGKSQSRYGPQDFNLEGTFAVYRINADGTGLKKLTGKDCNNFNACWLPDGRIAFLSDRKPAFAYCFTTTSPVLHRMDRDGGNITRISSSYLNDFTPSVLDDGRIVYSRWEYIDRPAIPIQSLWAINPDGTNVSGVFGNRAISPGTFMEAHSIPGTRKILCVLTSHNGPCRGGIGIIDVDLGANAQKAIRNLTPEVNIGRVDAGHGNSVRGPYESPWPLDEKYFLVSKRGTTILRDYDGKEQTVLLRPADGMGFYHARPLRARKRPPVIPSRLPAGPTKPWATVIIQDVYNGLEPHVKRGEIKKICIIQEIEKARRVPLCNTVPTGRGYAANSAFGFQFPLVSCGATYAAKKIWGYVPVDPDGSANFKVPTGMPIYFAAIDAQGRAVQRMRTFTHFMPGEVQSCVGCHANRNYATGRGGRRPTAALRKPVEITPPEWGAENFSYWKVVQPVLDKHCIRCHNARKHPKGVDLSGARSDFFNVSYDVLTRTGTMWANHPERHGGGQPTPPWVSWISTANGSESNIRQITPRQWGSPNSKLADQILAGHPDKDGKPRIKMTGAERLRIFAWIDLNIPYYGEARTNYPKRMGCRRMLPPTLGKVLAEVAKRRCASCHKGGKLPRTFYTRVTAIEDNTFLLAPLAKTAGGSQACGKSIFKTKNDPDYQAILKVFTPITEMLKAKPRMDMPGGPTATDQHPTKNAPILK